MKKSMKKLVAITVLALAIVGGAFSALADQGGGSCSGKPGQAGCMIR